MHIISCCSALMGLGRPVLRVLVLPCPSGAGLGCGIAEQEGEHGLAAFRRVLKAPAPCPQLLPRHPRAAPCSWPHQQHQHSGPGTKQP